MFFSKFVTHSYSKTKDKKQNQKNFKFSNFFNSNSSWGTITAEKWTVKAKNISYISIILIKMTFEEYLYDCFCKVTFELLLNHSLSMSHLMPNQQLTTDGI